MIWIVFDRDQVVNFDDIIQSAEDNDINVGWFNPCFEIWLSAYFGKMPNITDSRQCCDKFAQEYKKKTGQEYSKSDSDIYSRLLKHGDEAAAINQAKMRHEQRREDGIFRPSEMDATSTVYELVEEIRKKTG